MKQKHNLRKAVAILSASAMLALTPAVSASALDLASVASVQDISASHYTSVEVRVGTGNIAVPAKLIQSTTYVSLKYFCEAICKPTFTYNSKTRTATADCPGLWVAASAGQNYIVANGRYLWCDKAVTILDDGRTYVPVRTLARAFGLDVTWDAATRSVRVSGDYSPILSGDKFYRADEVYWLSRIISAESRGEPLLGQIAVGNVVLNRVRSTEFPNTIYGVIFDTKYGVQFTPVANGTIYEEPYYLSTIAAKLCLEGETVSRDALYFLEPRLSTSLWIVYHRPYCFTIGCHDFYR